MSENSEILRASGKAAFKAAGLAAITTGAMSTVQHLKLVQEGKISEEEAIKRILLDTSSASIVQGMRSGLNTAIGKSALNKMTKNISFAGVDVGMDVVEGLVHLATGKMSEKEFKYSLEKKITKTVINKGISSIMKKIGGKMLTAGKWGGRGAGLATLGVQLAVEYILWRAEKLYELAEQNTQDTLEAVRFIAGASERIEAFVDVWEEIEKANDKIGYVADLLEQQDKEMKEAISKI